MDTTKTYWFKRRRYGYGWVPTTWQGWAVIITFLTLVIAGSVIFDKAPRDKISPELALYIAYVLILVAILAWISIKKGPAPRWRWGKRQDDDPVEDY